MPQGRQPSSHCCGRDLSSTPQRRTAIAGGLIALVLIPFAPPGVPILASMLGVALARIGSQSTDRSDRPEPDTEAAS